MIYNYYAATTRGNCKLAIFTSLDVFHTTQSSQFKSSEKFSINFLIRNNVVCVVSAYQLSSPTIIAKISLQLQRIDSQMVKMEFWLIWKKPFLIVVLVLWLTPPPDCEPVKVERSLRVGWSWPSSPGLLPHLSVRTGATGDNMSRPELHLFSAAVHPAVRSDSSLW